MNLDDQLIFRPHSQLADLARAGAPVHLFVNPVEYHGPHLSLGNDRILSERIAQKLPRRAVGECSGTRGRLCLDPPVGTVRGWPHLICPNARTAFFFYCCAFSAGYLDSRA